MNYILDFTGIKTMYELHEYLKTTLEFPDYYGMNMSALWDCLYCGYPKGTTFELKNLDVLPKEMEEQTRIMIKVFEDLDRKDKYASVVFS